MRRASGVLKVSSRSPTPAIRKKNLMVLATQFVCVVTLLFLVTWIHCFFIQLLAANMKPKTTISLYFVFFGCCSSFCASETKKSVFRFL